MEWPNGIDDIGKVDEFFARGRVVEVLLRSGNERSNYRAVDGKLCVTIVAGGDRGLVVLDVDQNVLFFPWSAINSLRIVRGP